MIMLLYVIILLHRVSKSPTYYSDWISEQSLTLNLYVNLFTHFYTFYIPDKLIYSISKNLIYSISKNTSSVFNF